MLQGLNDFEAFSMLRYKIGGELFLAALCTQEEQRKILRKSEIYSASRLARAYAFCGATNCLMHILQHPNTDAAHREGSG